MTCSFVRSTMATAALAASLLAAPVVQAQSVKDRVVETLVANIKAAGARDVSFASVTGSDDSFTINTIKIVSGPVDKEMTATAKSATISGAALNADGDYKIKEATIADFEIGDDDVGITVETIKLSGVEGLAPAKRATAVGYGDRSERVEMANVRIEPSNEPAIPIASIQLTSGDLIEGIPRTGSVNIRGIVIPVDENKESMKELSELGYKEIALDIAAVGQWDNNANRLSLENLSLNGANICSLTISFALGNVTADAIKAFQAAQNDTSKQLEILQGFSIEALSLRFDNASIVDRLLDAQATAQGRKRDQYVRDLAAAAPLMVSGLNNKVFEKKVADAVVAFLKAPKSMLLTAKPAQPVPVAQIVGSAMVAPQTIPNILGVEIQANQ